MKHVKPNRQIGRPYAFYVNQQQQILIDMGVKLAGLTRSDFVRDAAMAAARKLIDEGKKPTVLEAV